MYVIVNGLVVPMEGKIINTSNNGLKFLPTEEDVRVMDEIREPS